MERVEHAFLVNSRSAKRQRPREQRDNGYTDRACESSGQYERPLHLFAAMFSAQTPLTQVLAVVAEETIAVLSDPGPRSPDHFLAVEAGSARPNPECVLTSKLRERNLFHRSPVKSAYKGPVMDDPSIADVNPVVGKTEARRNEV